MPESNYGFVPLSAEALSQRAAFWQEQSLKELAELYAASLTSRVRDTLEEWAASEDRPDYVKDSAAKLFAHSGMPTSEEEAHTAGLLAYRMELNRYGFNSDGCFKIGANLDIALLVAGWIAQSTTWYWSACAALYDGKADPDILCRIMGGAAYEKFLLENSKNWMDALIEEGLRHGYRLDDPLGRLEIAKAVAFRIACYPDAATRMMECARLASKTRIIESSILSMTEKYRRERNGEPEPKRRWRK